MNKQLFTDLCDLLKKEVPELKYIGWDEGQLNIVGERPPVAFPCCLIDLQYTGCRDLDGINQLVTCLIMVKIGITPMGESNMNAPEKIREKALSVFDQVGKIHSVIQGETLNDTVSEIARRRAIRTIRKDNIQVYTVTYETTFEECD